MSPELRKAWRDVREGGGRSLLVVFALALGLWGAGSVGVAYRVLSHDLRQNFLATRPPHAVVTFTRSGALDLAVFSSRPEIEAAEWRDLALLRVERRADAWIPLALYGGRDFEHAGVARVVRAEGAERPTPGAIRIERNGRQISDLGTGSVARVRSGRRNLAVPIDGLVFDPAQAPSTQEHALYGYTDPATFAALSGQETGKRLLVRWRGVRSKLDVERAMAELRAGWKRNGVEVASVSISPFLQHPHQWQLDTLIATLGTIGLLAFLLSSILVSQVVAALLAKQVRQVGILKAIGASRLRVTRIYALFLLFFAVASGAVAIPLAVATGYGFSRFCARLLNFEILTTRLPGELLALLILAAFALPFLFAGPTLLRAARIRVREAIAEPRIPLRRRLSRRAAVSVLATALGVAIFSTGFNVRQSLFEFLAATRDSMRFDLEVAVRQPTPRDELFQPFAGLPGIESIEAWSGGKGGLPIRADGESAEISIVSLPVPSRMVALRTVAGRWLEPRATPEVVLNLAALERFGAPRVGRQLDITIGGRPRRVTLVGVAEELNAPRAYLSRTFFDRWANPERRASTLLVSARDRSVPGVMALKREIERAVAASDLDVGHVTSRAEKTAMAAAHLNIILVTLSVLAFLVLCVSALGMASATSITVLERTREIGVLRAIGATPRRILRRIVAEGMGVHIVGVALGILLSWPLSRAAALLFGRLMLGQGATLRPAWSPLGFAITTVVSILFGLLATRIPAGAAVRISTREALAYE